MSFLPLRIALPTTDSELSALCSPTPYLPQQTHSATIHPLLQPHPFPKEERRRDFILLEERFQEGKRQ